jgi:hypothetical protein
MHNQAAYMHNQAAYMHNQAAYMHNQAAYMHIIQASVLQSDYKSVYTRFCLHFKL